MFTILVPSIQSSHKHSKRPLIFVEQCGIILSGKNMDMMTIGIIFIVLFSMYLNMK